MAHCDSYVPGQCTRYVCEALSWVPDDLGNATDWAPNALALGFATTNNPTVGAVVVYARGGGYSDFGHVAVVTAVHADGSFTVREMNFTGAFQEDYRVSTTYDVEGFILPPTGAGGSDRGPFGDGPPPGGPTVYEGWDSLRHLLNEVIPIHTGYANHVADLADRLPRG